MKLLMHRLAVGVTWGYLNSFGSFQTYYEKTMPDILPSTISWIGSVQIWLTMVGGIFTGRLLDAGFFLPTFFVGAVLQVLGLFLMSISKTYWQLMLTQGLLTGLGGGIFFTPSLALVTTVSRPPRPGAACPRFGQADRHSISTNDVGWPSGWSPPEIPWAVSSTLWW